MCFLFIIEASGWFFFYYGPLFIFGLTFTWDSHFCRSPPRGWSGVENIIINITKMFNK